MSLAQMTRDGTKIDRERPELRCFGQTFSGRDAAGKDLLLIEIELASSTYARVLNNDSTLGVLQHAVLDQPRPGVQLLAFRMPEGLSAQGCRPISEWLRSDALPIEQKRSRLFRIAQMIAQWEQASTSRPFFFPYLCPQSLVMGPQEQPWLLGAPCDYHYHASEFCLPAVLERFVPEEYVHSRRIAAPQLDAFAPTSPSTRQAYMFYSFGRMVLEAATGQEHYADDDLDLSQLPSEWQDARELIEKCLQCSWEDHNSILDLCKRALRPAPSLPIDLAASDSVPHESQSADVTEPISADESWNQFEPQESNRGKATETPRRSRMATGVLCLVSLLVGAALAAGYFAYTGVDPRNPGETRQLRLDVARLDRALERERLEVLLNRWCSAEVARRHEIESEIERIDPRNVNLRYLKLREGLGTVGGGDGSEVEFRELEEAVTRSGGPAGGDPYRPMFSIQELQLIRRYGAGGK